MLLGDSMWPLKPAGFSQRTKNDHIKGKRSEGADSNEDLETTGTTPTEREGEDAAEPTPKRGAITD